LLVDLLRNPVTPVAVEFLDDMFAKCFLSRHVPVAETGKHNRKAKRSITTISRANSSRAPILGK